MLKARKSKQLGKAKTGDILGAPTDPTPETADFTGTSPELNATIQDYEDPKDQVDLDHIRNLLLNNDLSGGFVRLLRKGPMDSQFLYVAKIDVEQFDIDQVKKTYGGGDYQAYAHRANGKMYRRFNFGIDARMKGALDEGAIRSFAQSPQDSGKMLEMAQRLMPQAPDNTPLLVKMMETTSQKSDQMMMLMMTMMSKSQETQVAAMSQAQQSQGQMMATMMTAMATLMSNNKGPDNTPILIEMIKAQSQGKSALGNISETVDLVKKLKEIGDGKSGDGEDDDKEETMLDKLIKLAGPIMQGMSAARGVVSPGVAMAAPRVVPSPPRRFTGEPRGGNSIVNGSDVGPGQSKPQLPQATTSSPTLPTDQQAMVGLFLSQCLKAAQRNSDPGIYADMIIDNLDDESLVNLQGILTGEDWCAKLFADDSRVTAYQGWFEELRQLILQPVDSSADEQDDETLTQEQMDTHGDLSRSTGAVTHGDAVSQTPLQSGSAKVIQPSHASASQPITSKE